jgi:hypothetical protein
MGRIGLGCKTRKPTREVAGHLLVTGLGLVFYVLLAVLGLRRLAVAVLLVDANVYLMLMLGLLEVLLLGLLVVVLFVDANLFTALGLLEVMILVDANLLALLRTVLVVVVVLLVDSNLLTNLLLLLLLLLLLRLRATSAVFEYANLFGVGLTALSRLLDGSREGFFWFKLTFPP